MTVEELIKELSKHNENLRVVNFEFDNFILVEEDRESPRDKVVVLRTEYDY